MTRFEFIEWLKTTSFRQANKEFDWHWREMVDYADYDEVDVEDDHVIFTWTRNYLGGSELEKKIYSFDEFVIQYDNYSLKN